MCRTKAEGGRCAGYLRERLSTTRAALTRAETAHHDARTAYEAAPDDPARFQDRARASGHLEDLRTKEDQLQAEYDSTRTGQAELAEQITSSTGEEREALLERKARGAALREKYQQQTSAPPKLSDIVAANDQAGVVKVLDVPLADYAPEQVKDRLTSTEFRQLLKDEADTGAAFRDLEARQDAGEHVEARDYHDALDEHRAAQARLLAYREETAARLEGAATTTETDFTLPDGVHQVGEAESGSSAWLRMRQATLGGSDVGPVVKVGEWGSLNYADVRASKMDLEPQDQTHDGATKIGDTWEPHLVGIASEALGEPVYTNKGTYSDGERHANLDGFTQDPDTGRVSTVVEMKTGSDTTKWETAPPPEYVLQTQHYMDVVGADRGLIVANINDERLVAYRVAPTDKVPAGPDTNKGLGKEFSYQDVREYSTKMVAKWNEDRERIRASGATPTRRPYTLREQDKESWQAALDRGVVIVDLETTHQSPSRGHVIEIAMMDEDGNTFEAMYDVPDSHAAWNGTGMEEVHGINRSMLAGKPVLLHSEESKQKIRDFIGDKVVVAHNARFEKKWLAEAGVDADTADTMRAFGAVVPNDGHVQDNTMRSLTEWSGSEYRDAHRAMPDVKMLADAYKSLRPLIADAVRGPEPVKREDAPVKVAS